MKNRYSWNFLVPEFSILEYSVWKFSVLGFYFPENSGIRKKDNNLLPLPFIACDLPGTTER